MVNQSSNLNGWALLIAYFKIINAYNRVKVHVTFQQQDIFKCTIEMSEKPSFALSKYLNYCFFLLILFEKLKSTVTGNIPPHVL